MSTPRHLIHVGFPKAGATFFKAWCQSREDVAFVPGGVAGLRKIYDLADQVAAPPALRVSSAEVLVTGQGQRARAREALGMLGRGPGTPPSAADLAESQALACQTLHDLFPGGEVLILVRGYRTLFRSLLTQFVKVGMERADLKHWEPFVKRRLAWARALYTYDRVVTLYEGAFGADRVTVLPYELLRDDTPAFVAALCRAAGVEYRPFDPGRVNASPGTHALGLILGTTRVVHAVAARMPAGWAGPVLRRYSRFLRRVRDRPALGVLGRALRVDPFPDPAVSDDRLEEAFAGLATAVTRRPAVAPYAAEYFADGREGG